MKGNKLLAVCNECSGLEFVKLEQLYEHFSQAHPDIPTTSTQPGETCHYKWKTKLQHGGHTAALCCNMCSFVTTELNVFQKHVEAHDEKDKRYEYHCKIDNLCGFRCETREQLAEHKKLLHKNKLECPVCGYMNANVRNLRIHMRAHRNGHKHCCHLCAYGSQTKAALVVHKVREHGMDQDVAVQQYDIDLIDPEKLNKNCSVTHCNFVGKSVSEMWSHMSACHKVRCQLCEFETFIFHQLEKHMRMKHPDQHISLPESNALTCKECYGFTTENQSDLHEHMATCTGGVQAKQCKLCNFKTSNNDLMVRHRLISHPTRATVYKCEQCDYSSESVVYFREHRIRSHMRVVKESGAVIYKCNICDYEHKMVRELETHILREHGDAHTDEISYLCETCSFSCSSQEKFYRHRLNHLPRCQSPTTSKYYVQCEDCSYRAPDVIQLGHHCYRVHWKLDGFTKRRRNLCHLCSYTADTNETIREHLKKVHHSDVRFICKFCDFATNHFAEYMRHRKSNHPDVVTRRNWRPGQKRKRAKYVERRWGVCKEIDPTKCSQCGFHSEDTRKVSDHIVEVHPDSSFAFDIQRKKKLMDDTGRRNKEIRKSAHNEFKEIPLQCTECEYKAGDESDIHKHIKEQHPATRLARVITYKEILARNKRRRKVAAEIREASLPLQCADCAFCAQDQEEIKAHITKNHEQSLTAKAILINMKNEIRNQKDRLKRLAEKKAESEKPSHGDTTHSKGAQKRIAKSSSASKSTCKSSQSGKKKDAKSLKAPQPSNNLNQRVKTESTQPRSKNRGTVTPKVTPKVSQPKKVNKATVKPKAAQPKTKNKGIAKRKAAQRKTSEPKRRKIVFETQSKDLCFVRLERIVLPHLFNSKPTKQISSSPTKYGKVMHTTTNAITLKDNQCDALCETNTRDADVFSSLTEGIAAGQQEPDVKVEIDGIYVNWQAPTAAPFDVTVDVHHAEVKQEPSDCLENPDSSALHRSSQVDDQFTTPDMKVDVDLM